MIKEKCDSDIEEKEKEQKLYAYLKLSIDEYEKVIILEIIKENKSRLNQIFDELCRKDKDENTLRLWIKVLSNYLVECFKSKLDF